MASTVQRVPAPHKWTKATLEQLNATFDSHTVIIDFNPPVFIPPEVQARMTLPQLAFIFNSNLLPSHRQGRRRI